MKKDKTLLDEQLEAIDLAFKAQHALLNAQHANTRQLTMMRWTKAGADKIPDNDYL